MNERKPPHANRRGDSEPAKDPSTSGGCRSGKPGPTRKVDVADYYITKAIRVSPSLAQDIKMASALERVTETELIITLISPGIQEIKRKHLEGLLEDLGDWNLEITFNI